MNMVPLTLQPSARDDNLSEFKAISLFTINFVFSLDNRNCDLPCDPHSK